MRIASLHATDFLSFKALSWTDIAPDLNTIVGPNGAGKTNLLHIPRVVMRACHLPWSTSDDRLAPISAFLRRHDAVGVTYEVGIGLALDGEEERRMLVDYFLASLLTALSKPGVVAQGAQPDRLAAMERHLETPALMDSFHWLFSGRLFVRWFPLVGRTAERLVYFQFQHGGRPLYLVLHPYGTAFVPDIPDARLRTWSQGDFWRTWVESLADADREGLSRFLAGEGDAPPVRLDFGAALDAVASGQRLGIEIPASTGAWEPEASGRLAETLGIPRNPARNVTLPDVFAYLLRTRVTVTANRRLDPRTDFGSIEDVWVAPLHLEDGADVGLQLFRWRNGSPEAQQSFQQACASFRRLSGGAELLVQTDPLPPPGLGAARGRPDWSPPAAPAAAGEEPRAAVRLQVLVRRAGGRAVPLAFAGAGVSELAYLSTLLAEPRGRVILLDEPGANLHPSTQRALRRELMDCQAQLLCVTHSPYLVDPRQPRKLWRLHMPETASELGAFPKDLEGALLTQMLEKTSDAVVLLFARLVVVVDGEEDAVALPRWFARWKSRAGRTLDDLNTVVFRINGKDETSKYLKFLSAYHVDWLLLCDGDGLAPGRKNVVQALRSAGIDVSALGDQSEFGALKAGLRHYGVFVVGGSEKESMTTWIDEQIEACGEQVPDDVRASKPRRARWAAERTPHPPAVGELFSALLRRCGVTPARTVTLPSPRLAGGRGQPPGAGPSRTRHPGVEPSGTR